VALPLPLPHGFDYAWPSAEVAAPGADLVGRRVRVPFGRGEAVGIVTGAAPPQARGPLKPVRAVLDAAPVFDPELWRTLVWAAGYYHHPLGEVLAAALPATLRAGAAEPDLEEPALAIGVDGAAALAAGSLRPGPGRDLLTLLASGPLPLARLREQLGDPGVAAARRLRARGWVEPTTLAPSTRPRPLRSGPPLHPAQAAAVAAIAGRFGRFHGALLEGVTGSGKTEVYLQLAARALAAERQVLVLVPEIGLTPQALQRYRERLPAPVLALHSGLSDRERARAWAFARSGRPCVVVGTRSAVFSPLPAAGLIVVDEEHDGSYKQADGFRYHARDLALVRGKALAVPVLLGSATPALETLALVAEGRLERLALDLRSGGAQPPRLQLLDLRGQRLVAGLAPPALTAIADTLARGEQALVFRNRRGFAPMLRCRGCGWHADCPRCDRPLTVHRDLAALICHHCGRRERMPRTCPSCGVDALDSRGLGTERIEAELVEHLPGERVLRVDRDSARSAARLEAALAEIELGQPAVLVGTQLLAKGHDWPMLTLAVIADADAGLFSPDFRAPERLAQLLTQVAGRAGRGTRAGTVLVQTRQPQHPFWARWLGGGYAAVAQAELDERRAGALPPFRHQALLAAEARDPAALDAFLGAALALPQARAAGVELLGPLPAPMPRRAGHHRAQVLVEADGRGPLHGLLAAWVPALYALPSARKVRWALDVDPQDLY
jgi:primosomal protein N' (replication factor Y)